MKKNLIFIAVIFTSTFAFAQNPLPNASFENWVSSPPANTSDVPVSWNTVNSTVPGWQAALLDKTVFMETTNPHTGTYCARSLTVAPPITGFPNVNGLITTGVPNSTTNGIDGGIAYTLRPDSLIGYFRANPVGTDHATFEFCLRINSGADTVGIARFDAPNSAVTSWTRFSAPIVYSSAATPETATCLVSSSNGLSSVVGSEVWVDDLDIVFNPTGIANNEVADLAKVIFANNALNININNNVKINLSIVDALGKTVFGQNNITSSQNIDLSFLVKGIYTYTLYADNKKQSAKVCIN